MAEPGSDRENYTLADETGVPGAASVIEEERIPLVEERIAIERRMREGRSVSVTTRPVTEEVTVREPVMREEVTIERVPVGAVVDRMPAIREDGDLTVIPVVEQRPRIVMDLVLVEEIHMRRTRREETHEQVVTLTRTEVDIDEQGSLARPPIV